MVISRTPYRLSLFGGGTDYPPWYLEHGGSVLATTINKYCHITCRYLPPFFEHRYRVVWSKIENCSHIDDISHPSAREILRYLNVDRGVEIHHDGDLPARSGTGSSSSFAVGLLHALHALSGRMVSKPQLADEAIHIEQDVLKDTVGSQDQVMAAHGGFNHVVFQPNGRITVEPMSIKRDRLEELESYLMLFYTGVRRTASDVATNYIHAAEHKTAQLQRMGELVDEAKAILNGSQPIEELGRLMDTGWRLKRELGHSISNRHVNHIYAQARSAGAIGGKLSGAGGGGFFMLFVPPALQSKVRDRLKAFVQVPIRLESAGSQIIYYDQEEDYEALDLRRMGQRVWAFRELNALPKVAEGAE